MMVNIDSDNLKFAMGLESQGAFGENQDYLIKKSNKDFTSINKRPSESLFHFNFDETSSLKRSGASFIRLMDCEPMVQMDQAALRKYTQEVIDAAFLAFSNNIGTVVKNEINQVQLDKNSAKKSIDNTDFFKVNPIAKNVFDELIRVNNLMLSETGLSVVDQDILNSAILIKEGLKVEAGKKDPINLELL